MSAYPKDLISEIRNRCRNLKSRKYTKSPPLPTHTVLENYLDVAYHASFQKEEGRRSGFRIILYSAQDHDKVTRSRQPMLLPFRLMPLDFTRPYTVAEINRLAPAAEMKRLLICAKPVTKKKNETNLHIWALLDVGENWWKFLHHETSGGHPPPNFLTITSLCSGEISISAGGWVLITLRNGQIIRPTSDALWQGAVSKFLNDAKQRMYNTVVNELGTRKYDPEGSDNDYPQRYYTFFLERILFYTRQKEHGGTILIVPNYFTKTDTRLTDRIGIKYPCSYNYVWDTLVKALVNEVYYFRRHFQLWDGKIKLTIKRFQDVTILDDKRDDLEEALGDAAQAIASLTSVDGAVVMTDQFNVLGFGAEVIAVSPSLVNVRVIEGSKKDRLIPITSFGTRHRSAFRFCSSLEDSVAFVVSQDGGVKAIKRIGSDVVLWPDINAGSMGI